MKRFPKKLVLIAALAELLILATAGRSAILPHNDQPLTRVNFMTTLSALPNASVMPVRAHATRPAAIRAQKSSDANEIITIVFPKAPQSVI